MDQIPPVTFVLSMQDKLMDLKLAILESHLQDQYDGVILHVKQDSQACEVTVTLQFDNLEDHAHFVLSRCSQHSQKLNMLP